jgi:hypothetical protein
MKLSKQKLDFDKENAQRNNEFQNNISLAEEDAFKNKQKDEELNSQLIDLNSELTNVNTV